MEGDLFKDAQEKATLPGTSVEPGMSIENGVLKVSARIPGFWPEEPEIWFAQIEGQFALAGITSDTIKFNYVIGQIENRHAKEVKDLIIKPPATNKYEKLKTELIRRLSTSNEKKIQQLLMHEELGDRRPSQFLRHLQGLANSEVPDDFLKTLWTGRLPVSIQTVLAGQPSSRSLEDLADLADRVHDIVPAAPAVAAVNAAAPAPNSSNADLAKEVAELRKQFQRMISAASRETLEILRGSARNPITASTRFAGTTGSLETRLPSVSGHVTTRRKTPRAVANGG